MHNKTKQKQKIKSRNIVWRHDTLDVVCRVTSRLFSLLQTGKHIQILFS